MTKRVTAQLSLDARVWGRLASIADEMGITVGDLIAQQIDRVIERFEIERDQLALLERELKAAKQSGYRAPQRRRKSA